MIRFITGKVVSVEENSIILLVNGIGYQIFVPYGLLNSELEELSLHIHSHIREDAFHLFGFGTKAELKFFEDLLSINGVGPKMALSILNMPINTIQNAIVSEDVKTLSAMPGIGKKKAERIILELKNKIEPVGGEISNQIHPDVFITLENLGYKRHHVQQILAEVDEEITEAEEWIRVFLKRV